MSFLELHLSPAGDGTGELHARVLDGDFSGSGHAWFHLDELHAFGQALSTRFPLAPGERVELAGGVWAERPGTGLRDRHVALPVYAIGATGTLGVRVALATPPQEDPRPDSRRTVALELTTDHESLRTFGHAISSLARGATPTAVLHGHQR